MMPHLKQMVTKLLFLLCITVAGAIEAAPSIAIVSESESENVAAILGAELSKSDRISLVERDQLDAVTAESLFSNLSGGSNSKLKLVGAKGILLIDALEREGGGFTTLSRFIDTQTGVVISTFELGDELSGADGLIKLRSVAEEIINLSSLLGKLEKVSALSISRFRMLDVGSDFADIPLVRAFQALLASRLQRIDDESAFVVLERFKLDEISFDHQFAGGNSKSWWASSHILNGVFESDSENDSVNLKMSLQRPDGDSQEWTIKLNRATLGQEAVIAADYLSREISGVDKDISETWDPEAEFSRVTGEARWAFSAGLLAEAESLAMTAVVLQPELAAKGEITEMLHKTRVLRCASAVYQKKGGSNFPKVLESAVSLGNEMLDQNYNFRAKEEVLRALTNVLFFGYRNRFHLDRRLSPGIAEVRKAARGIFRLGNEEFISADILTQRSDSVFIQWKQLVSRAGGLWYESKEEGLQHWNEVTAKSMDLRPRPVAGDLTYFGYEGRHLVPPLIDWSKPFDLESTIDDWIGLGDNLSDLDPLIQKLCGYAVTSDLREWYRRNRQKRRIPPFSRDAPALLNFLAESGCYSDSLGLLEFVRDNQEALLSKYPHENFYHVALYSDAVNHHSGGEKEWRNDETLDFMVGYIGQVLAGSDCLMPSVYDLFFPSAVRIKKEDSFVSVPNIPDKFRTRLDREGLSHFRTVTEPPGYEAYVEPYRNGIFERDLVTGSEEAVPIHSESVLTLTHNIHVGFPLEVASRLGRRLAVDFSLTDAANFSILDFPIYNAGKLTLPLKLTMTRLPLLPAQAVPESIELDLPDDLFGDLKVSAVYRTELRVSGDFWIHHFGVEAVGGVVHEFFVAVNWVSGEIASHRLSTVQLSRVIIKPDGLGNVYFMLNSSPRVDDAFSGDIRKGGFLRLLRYRSQQDQLDVIFDTLRSPAENFFDDRLYVDGFNLQLSPEREPVVTGVFEHLAPRLSLNHSLVLKKGKKDWSRPEHEVHYGRANGDYYYGQPQHFLHVGGEQVWHCVDSALNRFELITGPSELKPKFHSAPQRYRELPVATKKSPGRTISEDYAIYITPSLVSYSLYTRRTDESDRTLVLRVQHPDHGSEHFDLVINLENHPLLNQNYSRERDFEGGPKYSYQWRLIPWQDGIALFCRTMEQMNFYPITDESISEQLNRLRNSSIPLTKFETVIEKDRVSGAEKQFLKDSAFAIESSDIEKLKQLLANGLKETTALGILRLEPMHLAALSGNLDAVKLLSETGFSASLPSKKSQRHPIAYAVQSGDVATFEFFAEENAVEKTVTNPDAVPLFWHALSGGDEAMISRVAEVVSDRPLDELLAKSVKKLRNAGMVQAYQTALKLSLKAIER